MLTLKYLTSCDYKLYLPMRKQFNYSVQHLKQKIKLNRMRHHLVIKLLAMYLYVLLNNLSYRPVTTCNCLYLPALACTYLYICLPVPTYKCAYSYLLYLPTHVSPCTYLYMPAFTCTYLYLTVPAYTYLHISAFTCGFLYLCVPICTYL